MDKDAVRSAMRQALRDLRPLQRAPQEELVNAAVMALSEWASARTVLVFKAKAPELSVTSLTNAAWRDGKQVVFPRVDGDHLSLHAVAGWSALSPGAFGIDEPAADAPRVAAEAIDLAVVPGLAWTVAGDRLGQGGGFYDRLLPALRCPTVGVGFDVQLLEALPSEPHDRRVDRVLAPRLLGPP